jgi:hypothetical protein
MAPDEQRIKIAELCGWRNIHHDCGYPWAGIPPQHPGENHDLPDYENDLNAMHEAEGHLWIPDADCVAGEYLAWITNIIDASCSRWRLPFATAAQRAEAFVLTLEPEDK